MEIWSLELLIGATYALNGFALLILKQAFEKCVIIVTLHSTHHPKNRNISECFLLEKPEKIALLVGPEGGFSHMERNLLKTKKNVLPVSLGNRILRAETAAVAALTMWHGMVGDWINRVGHLNYES